MDPQQDILNTVLNYHMEKATDEQFAYAEANLKVVEEDEQTDGKTIISKTLYHDTSTDLFYEVEQCRDNCGYWGDGEVYDPEVRQVWRIPVASWQTVYTNPEVA